MVWVVLVSVVLLTIVWCALPFCRKSRRAATEKLVDAVLFGNPAAIPQLVRDGANLEVRVTPARHTPLILAAYDGKAAIMRLLLEQGAKVEAKNAYGQSALWVAAGNGSVECVRVLIEAGADPNARGGAGDSSVLHWAVAQGQAETARVLVESGAKT